MDTLNVKVIIGSTREGRFGDKPAQWIFEMLKKRPEISSELLDLRDYPMPFYDDATPPSQIKDGNYKNDVAKKFALKIKEGDAFIIVTPEYNHSTSGVLKNALDNVFAEWGRKPVAFVGYGSALGARAIEHLRAIAVELQMAPMRNAVHLPGPWMFPSENGVFKPDIFVPYENPAAGMIDQLVWWGNALKKAKN